jgi:hypothetical protein
MSERCEIEPIETSIGDIHECKEYDFLRRRHLEHRTVRNGVNGDYEAVNPLNYKLHLCLTLCKST